MQVRATKPRNCLSHPQCRFHIRVQHEPQRGFAVWFGRPLAQTFQPASVLHLNLPVLMCWASLEGSGSSFNIRSQQEDQAFMTASCKFSRPGNSSCWPPELEYARLVDETMLFKVILASRPRDMPDPTWFATSVCCADCVLNIHTLAPGDRSQSELACSSAWSMARPLRSNSS